MRVALLVAVVAGAAGAPATPAARLAFPDLVVSALEEPPLVRKAGSSFLLRHTVSNRGDGAARPTATRVYLSRDRARDSRDTRLRPTPTPALQARAFARLRPSLRIPVVTRPASYFVIACADALRRLRETNERNNCRASLKRVTVTRA